VFGYNDDFAAGFAVISVPSFLFKPPYNPNTPSLLSLVVAAFSQFRPSLNIKKRYFFFRLIALLEKAVARKAKIADSRSFRGAAHHRVSCKRSFNKNAV
jgi:hypothetical protein